jgi:Tol biopolymer transport system component
MLAQPAKQKRRFLLIMRTLTLTKTTLRLIFIFTLLLAIAWSYACEHKPVEPPKPLKPPDLLDAIPFERLGRGKLVFERIVPAANNYSGVYVVDIDNRRSWGTEGGNFDGPEVSPDGQKIAFSRSFDFSTLNDIHIMNIDGTNIQNVSKINGHDRQPSWTPDSSQILFWIEGQGGLLYRQSPVPNPPDRLLIINLGTISSSIEGPFFVSKNNKIVFIMDSKIGTMDFDGANVVPLTAGASDSYSLASPSWSPDGKKIAYLLVFQESDIFKSLELIVMNADGSNPRSLAKFATNATGGWAGRNDISLCWSPDGSKIAFNKKDGELISHIYLINSNGSGLTQVTFAEGVTDRSLSWSW